MFTQSKRTLLISFVAFALLLGGGAWAYATYQPQQATTEPESVAVVDTKTRTRTEITYTAKTGITSLEQLKDEADTVVVKDSEYGKYVDSIEGHVGGVDGKYWSFYVDGEMSEVGAGSYTQKGGEKIVWKYQKL